MADYDYRVIPFRAEVSRPDDVAAVAAQLETVIKSNATGGWEFYRMDRVLINVKPGCIGSLMGRSVEVVNFDQVIFRRTE